MIREPFFLARISRQNYEAIRGLLRNDLPDTYDEWFKLFTKEKLEQGQIGYDVREIEVDPHEFARFFRATRVAANRQALIHYAEHLGTGSRY